MLDRYKPTCGRPSTAPSRYDNYKLDFRSENKNKGSKEKDDSGKFRAALISGPPGIGKTTAAHLVGKSLGFNIVEFNASDTRSKKSLDVRLYQHKRLQQCTPPSMAHANTGVL